MTSNLNQVINPICFHFYKNYKGYQLYISYLSKYSWIIQVRDQNWIRVCWYTTLAWLEKYIQGLDTCFTFFLDN